MAGTLTSTSAFKALQELLSKFLTEQNFCATVLNLSTYKSLSMPISIKLKASLVRRTAQTLLDTEYDNLVSGRAIIDPAILNRLKLIVEMMDEVDPDDLVFVDEEAYAFLSQQ